MAFTEDDRIVASTVLSKTPTAANYLRGYEKYVMECQGEIVSVNV